MNKNSFPTALTIAGTDPSGGAGIMADLKSFQARQVYGMAAVTSVVAQNTKGVRLIQNVDLEMLEAQLACVFEDIPPLALKTGMIPNVDMMRIIRKYVDGSVPYVMDPVMVATSGDHLIDAQARDQFKAELMPVATLVTPNLSETEYLVGFAIESESDVKKAAQFVLNEMGPKALLSKAAISAKQRRIICILKVKNSLPLKVHAMIRQTPMARVARSPLSSRRNLLKVNLW